MNSKPLLPGVNPYERMRYHVIGPHSSFYRALRLLKSLKSTDQVVDPSMNFNGPPNARRRVSVVTLASSNGRVLVIRLLNILQLQKKSIACRRFLKTLKNVIFPDCTQIGALINNFKNSPTEVHADFSAPTEKLLASTNVPKVGFALKRDATFIMDDYKNENFEHQFRLNGFLENSIFKKIENLSHQSIDYFANLIFGVRFNTEISRNDWEATGKYLIPDLVAHAAKDATLAIQVFKYYVHKMFPPDVLNELNGRKLCRKIGGAEFIGRYRIKNFAPQTPRGPT